MLIIYTINSINLNSYFYREVHQKTVKRQAQLNNIPYYTTLNIMTTSIYNKSMKQPANFKSAVRSRRLPQLQGLGTSLENTISSEASVYTHRTNNTGTDQTQRTQKTATTIEFQDFEEIEELDTLFITPEEEKKIQSLLEFARKGKINSQNAFELPVKLIDPQMNESTNMRFWKIASELLHASMNIYDKRVENVYNNTNIMIDKLLRVQNKQEKVFSEEELEQRSRKKRGNMLAMKIEDIGTNETIESYEIGKFNIEQVQKLNAKKNNSQFSNDPLFLKRLQAFDSYTLSSLFLNQFQCGDELGVTFFYKACNQKIEDSLMKRSVQFSSQPIPDFIKNDLHKLNFIAQNHNIYEKINSFRVKNVEEEVDNKQFRELTRLYHQFKGQSFDSMLNDSSSIIGEDCPEASNQLNFQYITAEDMQCDSEDALSCQNDMEQPLSQPISHKINSDFLMDEFESQATMNPWDLQFKGLKLRRKGKMSQQIRNRVAKRKKNKYEDDSSVLMTNDHALLLRADIFEPNKRKLKTVEEEGDQVYEEKHLVPQNMDAFIEVRKMRRRNQGEIGIINPNYLINRAQNLIPDDKSAMAMEIQNPKQFNLKQENVFKDQPIQPILFQHTSLLDNIENQFSGNLTTYMSNPTTFFKTFGMKNIRDLKQQIFQRLLIEKELKMSELMLPLTPAGILIIFLHLVNEKGLQINSIDDQSDVIISIKDI